MSKAETANTEKTESQKPKKLTVSLAYSGLIYLPVYVAQELGLFGDLDVELVLSNGDDNAVAQLMHSKNQTPDNGKIRYSDIAICDPFSIAHKISDKKSDPYKDPEEAIIIGCMIDKPPVWIYRSYCFDKKNDKGEPLKKADDTDDKFTFGEIRDRLPNPDGDIKTLDDIDFKKIKNIHCYPSPNTGFLFGIDLISRGLQKDRTPINITKLDFDPLHCLEGENNELILTSNIVKIAYDYFLYQKDSANYTRKVIYTYSTGEADDKLRDFFFTGILANKKSASDKKEELVKFLIAIKEAIRKISAEDFTTEERTKISKFLTDQIKTYKHLDTTTKQDNNALQEIARLILEFSSAKDCNFYSDKLLVDPKLYNSTLAKRKEIIKNQEDLYYFKYVNLEFVKKINQQNFTLLDKLKLRWQTLKFWFFNRNLGQYIKFTQKNYPDVYSYSIVIFLIGALIIYLNYKSSQAIGDYIFGSIGILVSYFYYRLTRSYFHTYKRLKKIEEFPKLFLTIVYTIYISAIGGKLLSNYFAHKDTKPVAPTNINVIIKDDSVQFSTPDTTKSMKVKK